jgi:hypothetical protein
MTDVICNLCIEIIPFLLYCPQVISMKTCLAEEAKSKNKKTERKWLSFSLLLLLLFPFKYPLRILNTYRWKVQRLRRRIQFLKWINSLKLHLHFHLIYLFFIPFMRLFMVAAAILFGRVKYKIFCHLFHSFFSHFYFASFHSIKRTTMANKTTHTVRRICYGIFRYCKCIHLYCNITTQMDNECAVWWIRM